MQACVQPAADGVRLAKQTAQRRGGGGGGGGEARGGGSGGGADGGIVQRRRECAQADPRAVRAARPGG